ncbi:type II toxin-antitoxin system PemK/MazF family toxin [Bifidobacterium sp. ESL0769]|uniref:type II toxin-antitoxin system PemK/MazF family toxin n=1 Tax=Bifidobacterium sp. ESL0769 TaxID=2983229 RepID=UPI0023F9BD11|nr:type II toxin-antitoxin system PemK/MazF family toxin [Bifidobacterium sp. ESL0769]WEV67717.1 type II toxin-antitoxin system PemK/MazF family toxin [Bifidobacterium sp. ESL0769]
MKRGEIWTVRADGCASKPRPVVIVQSDKETGFQSVVTCLLTSYDSDEMPTRVRIDPSSRTGLNKVSYAMTDKIVMVNRELLGKKIGVVGSQDMKDIDIALAKVLGLALR